MPAQITCKFHKDPIKNERTMPSNKKWKDYALNNVIYSLFQQSRANNSKATGLIGQNSNLSEILHLSWLPASLTKIRSIMNVLAWRHHFPHYSLWEIFPVLKSTEVNDPIWLEFGLIWDFMPVLDTCKFGKDPIKHDWEKVETPLSPL